MSTTNSQPSKPADGPRKRAGGIVALFGLVTLAAMTWSSTSIAGSSSTSTIAPTTTTTPPTTTTSPPPTTGAPTTSDGGSTSTSPPPATTTTTTASPGGDTTVVEGSSTTVAPTRCAPPTTTTTTTSTTTLVPTTTTTTTTLVPTTTTTTLPPCPTTTTTAPPPTVPAPVGPTEAALGIRAPKHLADILLTIRIVESGQRYGVPPNRGGASGAYQYIDSTWSNYSGYPQAYLAPAHIQDQRALADVEAILARWRGDVSMVPVIWYYPAAAANATLLDQVPLPSAGNRLTVREYQRRWLDVLAYVTGNPSFFKPHALPPNLDFISGRPPDLSLPDPTAGGGDTVLYDASALTEPVDAPIAFPVLGHTVITPPIPCDYDECSEGTSAMVFGQKLQPVVAVINGVITSVELDDPTTNNVRVTLTGRDGRRFVYSGLNDDTPGTNDGAAESWLRVSTLAKVGTPVYAGQIIGFLGDSDPMPGHAIVAEDEPVWPHLRLTGYAADRTPLDTDLLVARAQQRQACHVGIGPWSVTADPLGRQGRDDVEVDAVLYGGWTIHGDGRVTAYGRSTLIKPPEDCVWAPTDRFGPGAAGNQPPTLWGLPFGISAEYWAVEALDRTALDAVTPSFLG